MSSCSMRGCRCSQSLTVCPVCRREVCYRCVKNSYDTEYGDYHFGVCRECVEDDPKRFLEEAPPKLKNCWQIISKLKKKEQLDENEINDLVEWLEYHDN